MILEVEKNKLLFIARFMHKTNDKLAGVCFEDDGTLTATDGHRLGTMRSCFETSETFEPITLMLGKNEISVLKKLKTSIVEINFNQEAHKATITAGDVSLNCYICYAKFPDYKKVIPAESNNGALTRIAFDANLLADFQGWSKTDRVKLVFSNDPQAPFLVYNTQINDFTGVLMPVRY